MVRVATPSLCGRGAPQHDPFGVEPGRSITLARRFTARRGGGGIETTEVLNAKRDCPWSHPPSSCGGQTPAHRTPNHQGRTSVIETRK